MVRRSGTLHEGGRVLQEGMATAELFLRERECAKESSSEPAELLRHLIGLIVMGIATHQTRVATAQAT